MKTIKKEEKKIKKEEKKELKKTKKVEKKKNKDKISYGLLEVAIISIVFMFFGVVLGYLLTYGTDTFTGKKIDKDLEEFISTYQKINENYYGELDNQKIIEAAINGMVNSIEDPYSSYMDEESADEFNEEITGSFVGIGVTVCYSDNNNNIIEVMKDYPAEKAGIKVGDIITKVDGQDVSNIFGDDLSRLIRGEIDTTVNITVKRGEEELTFDVVRDKIELVSVTSNVTVNNGKKVGIITIASFSSNTYDQFNKELKNVEKEKVDSLIIDVRDNLGGQLVQARKILNLFFDKKTVLFQIEDNGNKTKIKGTDNKTRDYPVAVIINNSSASASEVIAACFNDNYKNVYIVGEQSFGKGTIQKTISLKSGSKVKYTSQKWLTPKGKWIEGEGITPKYKVTRTNDKDEQLDKAIELVTK